MQQTKLASSLVDFWAQNKIVSIDCRHVNMAVRNATSRLIAGIAEKLGPGKVLSDIRGITDCILLHAARFTNDRAQETRSVSVRCTFLISFNLLM